MLALCMLIPLLVACDDAGTEGTDSAASSDASGNKDTSEIVINTPVVDLGGREVNVLCHDFGAGSASILGYTGEIIYAEENPSAVDEAKKRVIDHIEGAYNCTIVGEMASSVAGTSVPEMVKNQVTSGLHTYDICFDSLGRAASLALEDLLLDINEVENIDLTDPWWDKNAVNDLSIAGKVFFACGDINTYDDQGTWCILFNKSLKERLNLEEDFYQLVRDNKWTYDKFVEICTENKITSDTSGDGVIDELDTWAFGTETYNIYVHLVAAGLKIAEKDEDDLPYLTVSGEPEETYTILGKVLEFYNNENVVMVANSPKYEAKYPYPQNVWEATVHKAFVEGRELFYMCGLINVASFRSMEDEFGILPMPKYYETQDRFYHTVSRDNATVMFLPQTLAENDIEEIGTLITAISEYSMHYVTPAYYDVQLKYRDSRDDESGEMLDLIFDSRTFDLGCAYSWGGIIGQYMSLDQNIASRFESNLSSAESALDDMLSTLDFE